MSKAESLFAGLAIGLIAVILLYSHRESCILCGQIEQEWKRIKERSES